MFSPSNGVDGSWLPVKKYIEKEMKVQQTDEDPSFFDNSDLDAIHEILDTQHKTTHFTKDQGSNNMFQIRIIIDDFADDPAFARQSKMLHTLYIICRHNMINTITATQKFNDIHPISRANATELFVYRLRNMKDLETFKYEDSSIIIKETLLEL